MSENFEWQTDEEEAGWEQELPSETVPAAGYSRRRWLLLPALLLFAATAAGLLYLRANRLVAAHTAAVTADVWQSYTLLHSAARQGDGELVRLLLEGADPAWLEPQMALLEQELLWGRAPLGLRLTDDMPKLAAITFSPEFREAELTVQQRYLIDSDGRELATSLQHTVYYHLVGDRWLMVPPPPDAWGAWQNRSGDRLLLTYPERDAEIGARLAHDLDDLLARACQELNLDCPPNLQVRLRLDSNPTALLRWAASHTSPGAEWQPALAVRGEWQPGDAASDEWRKWGAASDAAEMILPAPGLVGLPLDEVAYQALYRAYAVPLVTALITDQVGWVCCGQAAFFHALLARQLSQLGLRPWPLGHFHYSRLLENPLQLQQFSPHWYREQPADPDDGDGWQPYALVDFAFEVAPELSLAERQRELSRASSYIRWAQHALGGPPTLRQFDRELLHFAVRQVNAGQAPLPVALPAHEIYFACARTSREATGRGRTQAILQRYQPRTGAWLPGPDLILPEVESAHTSWWSSPLPEYGGLLLYFHFYTFSGAAGAPPEIRELNYLWQGGEVRLIYDSDNNPPDAGVTRRGAMPGGGGRFFVQYTYETDSGMLANLELVDTAACETGDCPTYSLAGWPAWSPGGSHTLLTDYRQQLPEPEANLLYLAGALGQNARLVAEADIALWLEDETFAFTINTPESALYVATVSGGEPQLLLRPVDLEHLLPGDVSSAAGSLRRFLPGHGDADLLLIWMHAGGDYVVSYRRSSGEAQLVVAVEEGGEMHGMSLSPDGRWLAVTQWQEQSSAFPGQIYLHDLSGRLEAVVIANSSYFPGAASWSPDGRWLLTLNDHGVLTLYAPADDYRFVQVLDQEDCRYATWAGGQ
jgi:hypothetical protein